ncbi:MAG: hypothetical protein ACLFPV_15795 [Spirochaetaceae bacterium]
MKYVNTKRTGPGRAIILAAGLLLLLSAPLAFSFDWDYGGSLDNTTVLGFSEMYDETEIDQSIRLGAWFFGLERFESGSTLEVTATGSYSATEDRPYILDVDLLRARGIFPGALGSSSLLQGTVGRTGFSDPTGLVLNHVADGALVNLTYPRVRFRLGGAYTGLLISPSSSIRVSDTDYFEESTDDEFFGPKRAIGLFDVGFGGLTLFGLLQQDLRDEADGDTIDTQYLGVNGTARLGRSGYWDGFIVASAGQSTVGSAENEFYAFALGTGLRFFIEEWRFSRASLRGLYASPFLPVEDVIGFNINEFKPINEPTLGLAFSPRLSNLILTELSYSLRPFADPAGRHPTLDDFETKIVGRGFFRGYIGDSNYIADFDPESDSLFMGTEVELGVAARVFTDLGLGLRTAVFVPATGSLGAFSEERKTEWAVRLDLSTGF